MRRPHFSVLALFACGCLPLAACGANDPGQMEKASAGSARAGAGDAEGSRRMAERLAELAERTPPEGNRFASRGRLAHFRALAEPAAVRERLQLRFQIALEALNAGETAVAIEELSRLLDEPPEGARLNTRYLRELLAIAHLRLGEQENCIANHAAESCILPLRGEGIHTRQQGSRAAIEQYRALLADDPDDLRSRWLLDVAYMTVGQYPQGVPRPWLIPPQVLGSEHSLPRFENVAPRLGVDAAGLSGGAIMDDFDGDGLLDLWSSSFGPRDPLRFFRNNGDGTFSERAEAAGLAGIVGGLNLIHADYDNDGFRDVFVLRGAWLGRWGAIPNSLLRNNGDGTFRDVTEAAGLLSFHPTQTAAWGDFNNDGWLDLFIGNETSPGSVHPCELFVSNGDGTVREASASAGLAIEAPVKGVAWGDYDDDGLLDLYVSVLGGPNLLLRNRGPDAAGRWTFTDEAARAGVELPARSFPTWFWDYDNDGRLDILALGYSGDRLGMVAADVAADYLGLPHGGETPRLYRNRGGGTFEDVTERVGLDRPFYAMGSNFGDLDTDGWLDLYVGTGDPDLRSIVPNRMFRNDAGRAFQDVTITGGFGHLQKGHGVAFGDLDNDGDEDIYADMGGALEGDVAYNVLFENPGFARRWITVRLVGTRSNRDAIGARLAVTVRTPEGRRAIHRTVTAGGSFGASSLQQEIGLGDALAIERIEVTWPATGERQTVTAVAMDQVVRIAEGTPGFEPVSLPRLHWPGAGPGREHH